MSIRYAKLFIASSVDQWFEIVEDKDFRLPGLNSFMVIFFNIFSTLVTVCLGYWFCGHCVMVLKYGGPQGSDSTPYQRKSSPFRFWLYLAVYGALGVACVFMTLGQFFRLWELVMLFINAD